MKLNLRQRIYFTEHLYIILLSSFFVLIMNVVFVRYVPLDNTPITDQTVPLIYFTAVLPILVIWSITNSILVSRLLKNRRSKLSLEAFGNGMKNYVFPLSENIKLIAKDEPSQTNSYTAYDWGYCDYEFHTHRKSKSGRYRARTYYYAIGVFQLPRKLPNVFFDSKKTGKREFKFLFDNAQKHSLEGDFDDHFTTYFHEDYTIDNLSFLSPEVLQAVLEANEYDVEIYGDKLYLYNELELMPQQLSDIEAKGKFIRNKLLNNINSYRDERISYAEGRKTVSMLGLNLYQSLTASYWKVLLGLIITFGGLFVSLHILNLGIYMLIYGLVLIFNNIRKIINVKSGIKNATSMRNIGA